MKRIFFLLSITCTLIACTCGNKQPESKPSGVSASIVYNRDSMLYYAERAYLHDDPKGQYILAAAAYLRIQGELPDSIYAIGRWEADTMLMLSAAQGYEPAISAINCLKESGAWEHK